jgi:hypothetical protein
MKLLAIGTWDPNDPAIPSLLPAERQRTGELTEEGFVEQLLLRADGSGGYLILSAESAELALERLETLPLMQHGLMAVELIELRS